MGSAVVIGLILAATVAVVLAIIVLYGEEVPDYWNDDDAMGV